MTIFDAVDAPPEGASHCWASCRTAFNISFCQNRARIGKYTCEQHTKLERAAEMLVQRLTREEEQAEREIDREVAARKQAEKALQKALKEAQEGPFDVGALLNRAIEDLALEPTHAHLADKLTALRDNVIALLPLPQEAL